MSAPVRLADVERLVRAHLEIHPGALSVCIGCVPDEVFRALVAVTGASVRSVVYLRDVGAPYVIESIDVEVCGVATRAQLHPERPATEDEVAAARVSADLHRHDDAFSAAAVSP